MIGGVAGEGLGRAVDGVAALLLAVAVGLAAAILLSEADPALRIAATAAGGATAFFGAVRMLRRFAGEPTFPLPAFEVPGITAHVDLGDLWPEELLLTETIEQFGGKADELLLDDVLADVAADSRVRQLFEPAPTPGELQARIDRHLASHCNADATEELVAALEALRGSLR